MAKKRGKYADVIGELPRIQRWEPNYQGKINALKEDADFAPDRGPVPLARLYGTLRAEKETLDAKLSEANLRIAAVEQLLWDAYEGNGVDSIALDDGRSVAMKDEISARIVDHAAFLKWVHANNLAGILTLYASTVSSIAKERLLAKLEMPDGVEVGTYKQTRLG